MKTSDQINELATALAKAQAEIEGAAKDANNPFFKSKYADLASVIGALKPMAKYGLSFIQGFADSKTELITRLMHSSGQWVESSYPVIAKSTLR